MRVLGGVVVLFCTAALARRLPQNLPEPLFQALTQSESTIPAGIASLYHSTDAILSSIDDMTLSGSCPLVSRRVYSSNGYKNQYYTVGSGNRTLFVTFNIHGREYITGETALKLTKTLCGVEVGSNPRFSLRDMERIFSKVQLVYVPVLNLDGRRKVEQGAPCGDQRKNGNNVDLNRNFPGHAREAASPNDETYPGQSALSEVESIFVAQLATSLKPDGYLDVHSGERALGWPYAYDASAQPPKEDYLESVTSFVNKQIWNGKVWQGRLAVMGGPSAYSSQGTTCDYMYETQKVPFSATWEIYRESSYGASADQATSSTASTQAASTATVASGVASTAAVSVSDAVAVASVANNANVAQASVKAALQPPVPEQSLMQTTYLSGDECFRYFNPMSEASYQVTIRDWSDAIISLADALQTIRKD